MNIKLPAVFAILALSSFTALADEDPGLPPVPSMSIPQAAEMVKRVRSAAAEQGGLGLIGNATVKSKLYPEVETRLQVLTTMCSAQLDRAGEDLGFPVVTGVKFWIGGDGCRLGSCSIGCTGMALTE